MSILLGPYDKSDAQKNAEDDDLLVFGYACKLYRNDANSILENSGQLLIPWMGENALRVDRYDVRNKLDDKGQFGLKSNLSHRVSAGERMLEEELDRERYLALEWDEIRVEEQEEVEKRRCESGFSAVGFVYKNSAPATKAAAGMDCNMSLPEHPSTINVDCGEGDAFVPPPGLIIPEGIQVPSTNKLHSIIEKTASFTSKQGTQMEIIIKTKQKFNPFFSFLSYEDPLFAYYRHLKDMILTGGYRPVPRPEREDGFGLIGHGLDTDNARKSEAAPVQAAPVQAAPVQSTNQSTPPRMKHTEEGGGGGGGAGIVNGISGEGVVDGKDDSDSDDSDAGSYLHPLLMKASKPRSPPKAATTPPPPPPSSGDGCGGGGEAPASLTKDMSKKMSVEELINLHSTSSFAARSMIVNSAPLLSSGVASRGQATAARETSSDAATMAAYEHYKQQFYRSSGIQPLMGSAGPAAGYDCYPSGNPSAYYEEHCDQFLSNGAGPPSQPPHLYPDPYPHLYPDPYALHYSHQHQLPWPVPPAEARSIVDKTAEYVAKNSDDFERTVLEKHIGDSRFGFLNPWDQHHAYYTAMKKYFRTRVGEGDEFDPPAAETPEEAAKPNVQRLSSSGTVSFKLQLKTTCASSTELPDPCSQFNKEGYLEGEELVEGEGLAEGEEQECPPAKKQRVENSEEAEDDDIGSTVQAFLSTVKGLFGTDSA